MKPNHISRLITIFVTAMLLVVFAPGHAEDAPKKEESKVVENISTGLKTGAAMLKSPIWGVGGTFANVADESVKTANQLVTDLNSGKPGAPVTAAAHLANSLMANAGGIVSTAATVVTLTRLTPQGIVTTLVVRGGIVLAGELVGNEVKDLLKKELDAAYNVMNQPVNGIVNAPANGIVDKPVNGIIAAMQAGAGDQAGDPPKFQGSKEAQDGKPNADMMKNARSVFQTFADAKGDLEGHRDAAYEKIRAMNAKPKGLDYDSEPHTLKYENGAQVLGDQRGQPQGPVDLSQKGSMLPNRVAEPMVQGVNRAGTSGDGTPANTGGNGSNAGLGANGPATNAAVAGNAAATPVRAVMTAVRKRNIQDKIKNAPGNRPPGFEQAVAQLLKMAESGPALQQDDALEARIRAGDANAIQFFEFAKGYASGKGTLKEFEAMNKRLKPSR